MKYAAAKRPIIILASTIVFLIVNAISAKAQPASKGYVDGLAGDSITGWACTHGIAESVDVHVYVGGYAGNYGALVADGIADLPSGMDVDLECESGYYFHRYSVDLSGVKRFGGQTIWVHGINNYGGISVPVWNSGAFTVPEPVGAPAPPTGLTLNVGIDIITGQEIHGVSFTPVPGIQYYRISALRGDTAEHTEFLLTTTSAGFGAQPLAPMHYRVAACYAASASTCGMYSAPVDR